MITRKSRRSLKQSEHHTVSTPRGRTGDGQEGDTGFRRQKLRVIRSVNTLSTHPYSNTVRFLVCSCIKTAVTVHSSPPGLVFNTATLPPPLSRSPVLKPRAQLPLRPLRKLP
ncbi:hypothetical protein DNTS_009677 [Danionella cerebrum]|uniref:Uncharacterized protein n=1 Tax=Danionella cerebrum TaxID=2873325 RepID=A0A553NI49_9TELE|nr:hypothetical protein DNTS_009677 [Danionella translucida]